MWAALSVVAADFLICWDGIQQIGLVAVRERGSRVVRRTTAAAAEEPKPLPVFLRAAKINHGREAMMAALGRVAQHHIKFPGFDDVPVGLSAMTSAPGTYCFVALFVLSGVMELAIWQQDAKFGSGSIGPSS